MNTTEDLVTFTEDLAPHTVTASYKWTRDEFVEAHLSRTGEQVRAVSTRTIFGIKLSSLLLFGLALVMARVLHTSRTFFLTYVVLFLALYCFSYSNTLGREQRLRSLWKAESHREKDICYQFTPDSLIVQEPLATFTTRWDAFVTVIETRSGFLFYSRTDIFHWVPFHAFESPADVERVRKFIIQSEVPLNALHSA